MQLMVEGDKWEMYIPSELAPQPQSSLREPLQTDCRSNKQVAFNQERERWIQTETRTIGWLLIR